MAAKSLIKEIALSERYTHDEKRLHEHSKGYHILEVFLPHLLLS